MLGRNMVRLLLTVILTTLLVTSTVADTIELRSGGHLSGQARNKGDVTIIKIDDEIQVAVPANRISRTVSVDRFG